MKNYTCSNCNKKTNEVENCFGSLLCYKCYAEKLENELFQLKLDLENLRKQIHFYSLLDVSNPNLWTILQDIACKLQALFDKYLPTKNPPLTIKEQL